MKSNSSTNVKRLVVTAMLIALATALSFLRIWTMPLGGSVTLLSMLPIALISIEYGVGWGMCGAFVYSLVHMGLDLGKVLSWGLSPLAVVGCIVFDYVLAYSSIGLSGLYRKKGATGICVGVGIALFMRFVFHVISGVVIFGIWMPEGWGSPFIYSICYNGAYMLPELIITMAGSLLLFKTPSFSKLISSNLQK